MTTFRNGLKNARSHIVFLLALITAFSFIIYLEMMTPGLVDAASKRTRPALVVSEGIPVADEVALTPEQIEWASIAWRYFENEVDAESGLVGSVAGFPSSTMWDTGSYLLAVISAHRLEIIDDEEANERLARTIDTLASIPLYAGRLPNKSYDIQNLKMVDYANNPTERGIGWSALDLGRLLVPLHIVVWQYPQQTDEVRALLSSWKMEEAVADGMLVGAMEPESEGSGEDFIYVQEGRLGYEEYAAKGFSNLGLDVTEAMLYNDYLRFEEVLATEVPRDIRPPAGDHPNLVLSEPYVLDGLEFGWDRWSAELAYRVYSAQEARFNATGMLTAVTEDHIDRDPYFVYNTVTTDDTLWAAVTPTGGNADDFRALSTKAAFGWHALYRTPYTEKLVSAVSDLYDPEKGWYAGRYEKTGEPNKAVTCNTNAVVLESLAFIQTGPLFSTLPIQKDTDDA